MADYTASNTKRIKVLQTGPRGSHHMVFRFPEVQSEATMITQARNACSAMIVFCMMGTSFASAEVAHEGSEVFLPVVWGVSIDSASVVAATNTDEYGRYLNFVGRSTGGSRAAFYLFNVSSNTGTANNRFTAAESAQVTTVINTLQGSGINIVAIDQNPIVMKAYANSGINDAVAKKSRAFA